MAYHEFRKTDGRLTCLKWMVGCNLALSAAILGRLLCHAG
jgi:hypothetical protein